MLDQMTEVEVSNLPPSYEEVHGFPDVPPDYSIAQQQEIKLLLEDTALKEDIISLTTTKWTKKEIGDDLLGGALYNEAAQCKSCVKSSETKCDSKKQYCAIAALLLWQVIVTYILSLLSPTGALACMLFIPEACRRITQQWSLTTSIQLCTKHKAKEETYKALTSRSGWKHDGQSQLQRAYTCNIDFVIIYAISLIIISTTMFCTGNSLMLMISWRKVQLFAT